jgi:2-polyprenyl-6-methoxyphenol hydroxylase-like FAD-dependent oxidoreductase
VIAGGLGCRVFAEETTGERQMAATSRVGAGTVLEMPATDYPPGTIHMACHRDGYVGLVRLEDGRLDIAAALDPSAIKRHSGIGPLVERILEASDMPTPAAFAEATWHGTARLTQRRDHVGGPNYFVVGDAAGYIEPFTGEGIAWALATGRAVVPYAYDYVQGHVTDALADWSSHRTALIGGRMHKCGIVSRLLRYPLLVSMAIYVLAIAPGLAHPFVKALNKSFATK